MPRKKTCGIYKITSPSGRIYIGQSRDIERRFSSYTWKVMRQQHRLRHSFEKYGVDKHVFEIIEECKLEDLNKRERFYQEKFDVLNQKTGLNCVLTQTDDKPQVFSEDSRRRMSESNVKCMTPDVREKIRQSMLGKEVPQERRDRISAAMKGSKKSRETRRKMSAAQKKCCRNRVYTEENRRRQSNLIKSLWENEDFVKKNKDNFDKHRLDTSRIVLDVSSGVYYNSMSEVCKLYKMSRSHLCEKLNGKKYNNTRFIIA